RPRRRLRERERVHRDVQKGLSNDAFAVRGRPKRGGQGFTTVDMNGPIACSTYVSSGSAPRISTVSFTTVFGTPFTWYLRARSGNSVASTSYAVMLGFDSAISCARLTARGQCGHVGVVN